MGKPFGYHIHKSSGKCGMCRRYTKVNKKSSERFKVNWPCLTFEIFFTDKDLVALVWTNVVDDKLAISKRSLKGWLVTSRQGSFDVVDFFVINPFYHAVVYQVHWVSSKQDLWQAK